MWLCLFEYMCFTVNSKTRMEICDYKKCTYKNNALNNPSIHYLLFTVYQLDTISCAGYQVSGAIVAHHTPLDEPDTTRDTAQAAKGK